MTKSASDVSLGIIRSTAMISLGLVALAGSIASVLIDRIMTPPNKAQPTTAQISKLVTDEWEADLARLNLPSRNEVEAPSWKRSSIRSFNALHNRKRKVKVQRAVRWRKR